MTQNHRLEIVSTSGMFEPDSKALEKLYVWVDEIPLSRPKRNMGRDFADAVMTAEILHYQDPRLVDVHNYITASALGQKIANWQMLNRKVLCKLGLQLSPDTIRGVAKSHPWIVENVLLRLRDKIDDYLVDNGKHDTSQLIYDDQPEVDQHRRPYLGYQYNGAAQRGRLGNRDDDIYSPSWSEPMVEPTRRYVSPTRTAAAVVPAILLVEKQRTADAKDEAIDILGQKIKRLEHLMTLKDLKIEDLNIEIYSLKAGKHNTSPSTSPVLARKGKALRNSPNKEAFLHQNSPSKDGFLQPKWQ